MHIFNIIHMKNSSQAFYMFYIKLFVSVNFWLKITNDLDNNSSWVGKINHNPQITQLSIFVYIHKYMCDTAHCIYLGYKERVCQGLLLH